MFVWVCVGCLGGCLVLLTFTVYLLFSSVLFFSLIFFNLLFSYILVWAVARGMHRWVFMGVCRLLGWLPLRLAFTLYMPVSSVSLPFSAILYYPILFYSILFYSILF